jgi:hypothetical protein
MNHREAFTRAERAALDAWAAPVPAADFAARVLARTALCTHDLLAANITPAANDDERGERGPTAAIKRACDHALLPDHVLLPNHAHAKVDPRLRAHVARSAVAPLRSLAAVALFALVLGGLWSLRAAGSRASDSAAPARGQRALWVVPNDHDAGPRPEAAEVHAPAEGDQATPS